MSGNFLNFVLSRQMVGTRHIKHSRVIKMKDTDKPICNRQEKKKSESVKFTSLSSPIQATLPPSIIERANKSSNGMMRVITELESYVSSDTLNYAATRAVLDTLQNLHSNIYGASSTSSSSSTQAHSPNDNNHAGPAGYFILLGGVNYLKSILIKLPILWHQRYGKWGEGPYGKYFNPTVEYKRLKKYIYRVINHTGRILHELMFLFDHLGNVNKLQSNNFIIHIFQHLLKDESFDMAVELLEAILSTRADIFCVADVPNIYEIIRSLNQRQLCVFCRVYALLIFDDVSSSKKAPGPAEDSGRDSNDDEEEQKDEFLHVVAFNSPTTTTNTTNPSDEDNNNTSMSPSVLITNTMNMHIEKSSSTSSTLPNSTSNSPFTLGRDINHGLPNELQSSPQAMNDIEQNTYVQSPTPTKQSSSPSSSSQKKRKNRKKLKNIPLLKDKGRQIRRNLLAIDRNHAVFIGHKELLDRLLLLVYKSIKSLPVARYYHAELHSLSRLQPSPELLDVLNVNSKNTEEEEWYKDLNEMEETFYGNHDNIYNTLYNKYLMKRNIGKSNTFSSNLEDIFIVLRNAIGMEREDRNNQISADKIASSSVTMKDLIITNSLVEILFVLAILCHGSRKADLQEYFKRKQLGTMLNKMFNSLDWTPEPRKPHGPHGPGCQCNNSASAVKIQFLRLTHNYCETEDMRISHRLQLLSMKELKIRSEITKQIGGKSPNGLHEAFRYACSEFEKLHGAASTITPAEMEKYIFDEEIEEITNPHGLLSKILKLLTNQTEESYSAYRFWFATCVESYLRGGEPEDQIIVASHKGFLQHLITDLLNLVGSDCNGLQTNFDLLSEVIKFNSVVLEYVDSILSEEQFRQLFDVMSNHLVDSNVFIRSLAITLEFEFLALHKLKQGDLTHNNYEEKYAYDSVNGHDPRYDMRFHVNNCYAIVSNDTFRKNKEDDKINVHNNNNRRHPLLYEGGTKFHTYFQTHRQQILCDICTAIDVTKISQENLCCLNTTIILLVFSHIHGALADDVAYLKAKEKEWQIAGSIVIRLRRLLWFWDKYYHKRAHDRLSLEISTRIPFHMFDEVVDILVKDNGEPGSLCDDKTWMREWEYLAPMFASKKKRA
jgi:hypothetical protein